MRSLLFGGAETDGPVLVLASGPNRVDGAKIFALLEVPVVKADAALVPEKADYAIGGVPPFWTRTS